MSLWKFDCSDLRKKLLLNLQNTLIAQGNPDAYGIAEKVELEAFNSSESEDMYTMRLAEWLAGVFHQQHDSPPKPRNWYETLGAAVARCANHTWALHRAESHWHRAHGQSAGHTLFYAAVCRALPC